MRVKKSIMAASAAAVIGLGTFGGIQATHAATATATNPMSGLVNAIAQKFNLNPTDVQQVFDDNRQHMMAEHEQEMKDRLAQAVTDGKLTQAQVDQITAKQAEMKTFFDSLKDKSETDRQAALKTKMEELQQWAKDNNIPRMYVMMGGHGFGLGHGRHFMRQPLNNQ